MRLRERGLVLAACLVLAGASPALAEGLLGRMAGTWTGSGTGGVAGAGREHPRCRMAFQPAGDTTLLLDLQCASEGFAIHVRGQVAQSGRTLTGEWTELRSGIAGTVSGSAGPSQAQATVSALGLTAVLSLRLRGRSVQEVSLVSQQLSAGVTLAFRRA